MLLLILKLKKSMIVSKLIFICKNDILGVNYAIKLS